jgi:hypothetical protein
MADLAVDLTIISEQHLVIILTSGVKISIVASDGPNFSLPANALFLLTKRSEVKLIAADKALIPKLEFDQVIIIELSALNFDQEMVVQVIRDILEEGGVKLAGKSESLVVPTNLEKSIRRALKDVFRVLAVFKIKTTKVKHQSPKAQHRFNKALVNHPFFVDKDGSKATVYWQKRDEMLIKAGATMIQEVPLLQNGKEGFQVKFAKTLRAEQASKWDPQRYVTTEDIVLKSVNEVGHFLYFAGSNSWLELIDADGKSIHELTVVK